MKMGNLEVLIERLLDLEGALKRVELGVFPRRTQRKAVEYIIFLLRNLRSSLEPLSSSPSASISSLIEKGYELLQAICNIAEKIERSNVHYTPLGAVYLAEYLAGKVGEGIIPIICFQSSSSSCARLSDLLKITAPLLPLECRKLKEDVVFFTLPYFLKNDPLSHCLIARELALHLIETKGLLKEALTKASSPHQLLTIAADRLATLMVGPAYLFSLLNINFSSSGREERIQSIVHLLVDEGYYEKKALRHILPSLAEARPPAGVEYLCEMEERFKKTAAYYSSETFESEVPQLVSRLLDLLPPNEVTSPDMATRPAEVPSIINAGWVVKQHHMSAFYKILKAQKPEEKYHARRKLDALIEKAIELSVIHKSLLEAEI
ncbi:MAG: hypothetical protein KIH01_04280 [Candidatus Freyarchaeota archaeon]|nr:hypothetical protein [Candidatus Jordarchaeia archaeon]